MKEMGVGYEKEFKEQAGNVIQAINEINDPVAIGVMLYSLVEERKSSNLIFRNLNAKIDSLISKIEQFEKRETTPHAAQTAGLSERDVEVLEYVKKEGRVCADKLKDKFKYKGKNAASARLSKLFHEGILEKEYAGRKVYYKVK
ncbi:MAG: hypothetical protein V1744_01855 [Candidatus Altiarchaeota archaeon]